MILYIHGFRTTKTSYTSRLLKKHYQNNIILAQHPIKPKDAIKYLENIIQTKNITSIMASSLGGFYAIYLATKYNLKTVLINPSINPYKTTKTYIGKNITEDGLVFSWKNKHLKQLAQYKVKPKKLNQKIFYIMLQKGDQVLDYKIAKKRFSHAKQKIENGGSHRFDNLKRHFKSISSFIKEDTKN
ncbi:MAG: YqiA/YcfP family alpha/beta fold hydrolase [Arcobacteraceae bacterium]